MTRDQKIAAIRAALTEEERGWLCEVIETVDVKSITVTMFDVPFYREQRVDLTLMALAEEFK